MGELSIADALEAAKADHANSYLKIGAILHHVQESGLWKETHESFAQFVTEHGFSRSWAYQCIGCVVRFGERGRGILPSRLQQLLPLKVESKDKEDLLLSDAKLLAAEAFHNVITERKGGKATDTCDHHELGSYCKGCGKHIT